MGLLQLNGFKSCKSKEIVFHLPNLNLDVLPTLLDVDLIDQAELLGIIITNNMHFDININFIFKT
jgi:hypothetical protein